MPPLHGIDGTGGTTLPTLTGATTSACLTLSRYARMIDYDEHRFWGVQRQDWLEYQCREYWTRAQRQTVARYLAVAQSMIETELKYSLCPAWVANEEQPYTIPLIVKQKRVIEAGVRATATIQAGAVVDHSSDPAVVGPMATTVTNTSEVVVYYPGTTEAIEPQQVTISSGQLTIYIPRCRLVNIAQQGEPIAYDVLANFTDTVDVVRVYNDPSSQAELVWDHQCGLTCAVNGCSEYTQTACMYTRDGEIGSVHVQPATYADGTWTKASCANGGRPYKVRLNYRAGLTAITPQMEDAIVRLAHTLMPAEPCGCTIIQQLWKRDRNVPLVLDRERINCPFGMMDGAWIAWRMCQVKRYVGMGVI